MEIKEFFLRDFKLDVNTAKHGGEADVYKETHKEFPGQLAIKKWRQRQSFEGEIELLKQLSHENVIQIFGRLVDSNRKLIGYVMPYMPNGSLNEVIHDRFQKYDKNQAERWILEICCGLEYLHSKNIVHRDIKPHNILLEESRDVVKLSDFGIARSTESITQSLTTGIGTPVYMAPEILNGEKYNISADIYSLSITVWEVLCRRYPYDHIKKKAKLSDMICKGERPQLTNDLSQELSSFLKRCWDANTSRRPAIIEIVDFFTKETILLTGGSNQPGVEYFDSLLLLINNRKKWKKLNIKLPYPVHSHGAQFLNNHLYIFGGINNKDRTLKSTYKLVKSPEWYKLGNFRWEKMADMNEKRYDIPNNSVILNNQIWVCGGGGGGGGRSVEMYDPLTNKWKYMKEMNECRVLAAATAVIDGKIFCSGGFMNNSVECYDPSSDVWTIICNMPQAIRGHGAVEINGNFIVMGGLSRSYPESYYSKDVWLLDTTNKNAVWIEKPSMSISRKDFSMAKIDDNIYVCGGNRGFRGGTDKVEIFDGKVWRNGPKMPIYRRYVSAVVIPMQFARSLK